MGLADRQVRKVRNRAHKGKEGDDVSMARRRVDGWIFGMREAGSSVTLAQAMERVPWGSMRLEAVLRLDSKLVGDRHRFICQVCDNEFGLSQFAVVVDIKTTDRFYVDVGPKCASDIRTALEKQEAKVRRP